MRPAAGGRIADLTSPTTRTAGFARFDAGWQFGVVIGPILVGVLLSVFNEKGINVNDLFGGRESKAIMVAANIGGVRLIDNLIIN